MRSEYMKVAGNLWNQNVHNLNHHLDTHKIHPDPLDNRGMSFQIPRRCRNRSLT